MGYRRTRAGFVPFDSQQRCGFGTHWWGFYQPTSVEMATTKEIDDHTVKK
jgi:hypothetical protein